MPTQKIAMSPASKGTIFDTITALKRTADITPLGRDTERRQITDAIQLIARGQPAEHVYVHGRPGRGKTTVITDALDNTSSNVDTVHVNCWQQNTTHKVLASILGSLRGFDNYQQRQMGVIMEELNGMAASKNVVVFLENFDYIQNGHKNRIIGTLLEINKSADGSLGLILEAGCPIDEAGLDEAVRSRLTPLIVHFEPYDREIIREIVSDRAQKAFEPGTVEEGVVDIVTDRVHELGGDISVALNVLRRAGQKAEREGANTVTVDHVQEAMNGIRG